MFFNLKNSSYGYQNMAFVRSGHMVRNKLRWDTNNAVGLSKQKESRAGAHSGQTQKSNATSGFGRLELRKSLKRKPARLL